MSKNSDIIKAIINAAIYDQDLNEDSTHRKRLPVVTVSRGFGSNGSKTAELLAKRLGVECYGYSLLDSIVDTLQSDKHLAKLFDEKLSSSMEDWILTLLTGGKGSKGEYLQVLVEAVTAISKSGGVIIGRGAHLILSKDRSVFRVRLEGSLEVCAKRIAEREGVKIDAAKALIQKTDGERKDFVRALYQNFPTDRAYYDLLINSDHLEPEKMINIIVFAMEQMGLPTN